MICAVSFVNRCFWNAEELPSGGAFVFHSRFRNGMKDLEVMMQNLLSSAFDTVTTVEQGVEVLDIFMHLSTREVGTAFYLVEIPGLPFVREEDKL